MELPVLPVPTHELSAHVIIMILLGQWLDAALLAKLHIPQAPLDAALTLRLDEQPRCASLPGRLGT